MVVLCQIFNQFLIPPIVLPPKFEIRSTKFETKKEMTEIQNSKQGSAKQYDLEERTLKFAKAVRIFVKTLPKNTGNFEDTKQLVRSSGSIGANYIEANESLSKKDFVMRIKIARKEAKETLFWLNLLDTNQDKNLETECFNLIKECRELMLILGSILRKSEP